MQMKLIDCDGSLLFFSLETPILDFVNRRGPASHSPLAPFGAATVTGAAAIELSEKFQPPSQLSNDGGWSRKYCSWNITAERWRYS
jgi:hypothetical protein